MERSQAVRRQIEIAKQYDQADTYELRRGPVDWLKDLRGIGCSADYVRAYLLAKAVLDIGSGTTEAVSKVFMTRLARGLGFFAAVLTNLPEIADYLGGWEGNRIFFTPVEELKGIRDGSVGLATANYSVVYSSNPRLAAASMDRVLCPGGLVKLSGRGDAESDRLGAATASEFQQPFAELGYDTYCYQPLGSRRSSVFVAIKPGVNLPPETTAEALFWADHNTLRDQINEVELALRPVSYTGPFTHRPFEGNLDIRID